MLRFPLVLLALALAGCDSAAPVEGRLVVSLFGEAPPTLRIETEERYPCIGYALRVDAEADSEGLRAEVEGVDEPSSACLDASGPATWTFALPADAQIQEYAVEIVLGGQTDRYVVRSGIAGTSLVPVRTTFSRPQS